MTCYECVYIARQELTTAQTDQLSDELSAIVTNNSGKVENHANRLCGVFHSFKWKYLVACTEEFDKDCA